MHYFILNEKAVFNNPQDWISKAIIGFVFGRFTIHVVFLLGN